MEVEPGVVPAFARGPLLGLALSPAAAEAVADALAVGAAVAEVDQQRHCEPCGHVAEGEVERDARTMTTPFDRIRSVGNCD